MSDTKHEPLSFQIVPVGDHYEAYHHILEQMADDGGPLYYRGEKIEFLGADPYRPDILNCLWRDHEYERRDFIQMLRDIDNYVEERGG